MARYNGTFKWKPIGTAQKDPVTGFPVADSGSDWQDGCECQIDKGFPAIVKRGTDGQEYGYNYDVFIPKIADAPFAVGMTVQLTDELGEVSEVTIQGVDVLNRRYTEIWG
jgi:hypothetical protein